MARTAPLFVSLVLLVAAAKKAENVALVVGTQENLSHLDFLYISMTFTLSKEN